MCVFLSSQNKMLLSQKQDLFSFSVQWSVKTLTYRICSYHWFHNSSVFADLSSTSQPTKTMTLSWLPVYPVTPGKQTMTHTGLSTWEGKIFIFVRLNYEGISLKTRYFTFLLRHWSNYFNQTKQGDYQPLQTLTLNFYNTSKIWVETCWTASRISRTSHCHLLQLYLWNNCSLNLRALSSSIHWIGTLASLTKQQLCYI